MPPKSLKIADFGGEPEDIENRSGKPLYRAVKLNWSKLIPWEKGTNTPTDTTNSCIYVLLQEDKRYSTKNKIKYVGLSANPSKRFINHSTAHQILKSPGKTYLSFAEIDFIQGRNRDRRIKKALEDIEHLMIWALWTVADLQNERKVHTLPGIGASGGEAWKIENSGYRFNGRMPKQIVYPWMLIQPGRDRSNKIR